MTRVGIVDYGMGNLDSVGRAVEECGGRPVVVQEPDVLKTVERIILPGVGAFSDAMRHLGQRNLIEALSEQVLNRQVPFLGICLGMQLMATRGEEGGGADGLGWIKGEVRRLIPAGADTRIPHIGWNEVLMVRPSPLFEGIGACRDFYFVHSYHFCPADEQDVVARTPYGSGFVSAIQRDAMFGVQFHPEKSQWLGFRLIKNFLAV